MALSQIRRSLGAEELEPAHLRRDKSHFVGKGYFVFVFENPEDKNLIFRNGPYFMGPQGLYLNKWTPDFDST